MIREWADGEDQEKIAHDERQWKQYNNRNDDRQGDAWCNDNQRNDNSRGDERRWNNSNQSRKRKLEDTVPMM